ncbi:YcaO-like family protein [Streptomyces uncialis]|uniref:YcaO-like family protein n=1 Tax=Streptomyces uncialis TaxID=1048205 RepID=UPI002E37BDE4|nr:YcaO-like family protein [Streptomyces uncialis]
MSAVEPLPRSAGSGGSARTAEPGPSPVWPVQVVSPFPDAPRFVLGRTAARSSAFTPNDAAGGRTVLIGAATGTDRADVARRARGELMERMHNVLSGHRAREGAVVASYASLRRRGTAALDPCSWAELRSLTHLREAAMPWVTGTSLTGGGQVLVPACAVYLAHRPPAGCPAPLRPGSTGLAAHDTAARAREHAVLEILERDLLWHAWYADAPRRSPRGPAPLDEELRRVLVVLGLRERCLVLPGPGGISCVVACVHIGDGTQQSFGARATSGALGPAAVSAVREALMVRWSMGTASARTVWARMREQAPDRQPSGPLEHALHTFHRQDSLTALLRGATWEPWTTTARGPVGEPRSTARASAADPWATAHDSSEDPWMTEPDSAEDPRVTTRGLAGDLRVTARGSSGNPGAAGHDPVRDPGVTAPGPAEAAPRLLAERTGEDVVEVDTSVSAADGGRAVVVRVIAPGARRMPVDEPDRAALALPAGNARRHPPHPLG